MVARIQQKNVTFLVMIREGGDDGGRGGGRPRRKKTDTEGKFTCLR